jgi:hypothetical protein
MREIIAICIVGVATLFGLPLWLLFIAGHEQEHINPDIHEDESNRAWALDTKEKYTAKVYAKNRRPERSQIPRLKP